MRRLAAAALLLMLVTPPLVRAAASTADERLRQAKTLYFDRKYDAARQAWQAVRAESRGAQASAAAYWVARSTEALGEHERALSEYGTFLALRPLDPALAEEARTSRVGLAAKLHKAGNRKHEAVLRDALADPSRTVRYYAALQTAGLGAPLARSAAPVLRQIIAEEKDADLVDRARLALLRADPSSLGGSISGRVERRGATPAGAVSWLRVRIYEKGGATPAITLNLPVGLAEIAFKSLPDDAKADLRRQGYDADNFWERLRTLKPAEILTVQGGDGSQIKIWVD